MTRRDYCAVCDERVSDYDVMCVGCSESFCCYCPTGCTVVDRLALLFAMVKGMVEYVISDDEWAQILLDLHSAEFKAFVNNIATEYKNSNLGKTVETALAKMSATDSGDERIKKITTFVENMSMLGFDEIPFCCQMCHNDIKVEY